MTLSLFSSFFSHTHTCLLLFDVYEGSDLFISEIPSHSLVETGWALMPAFDTDTVLPPMHTYIHIYIYLYCTLLYFQLAHSHAFTYNLHTCMFIVRPPHIHFHTSTPAHIHTYRYAHTLAHAQKDLYQPSCRLLVWHRSDFFLLVERNTRCT